MDYSQDFFYSDIFNYSTFFENEFLSDCEIRIHSKEDDANFTTIKSHKVILSNSSLFFYNIFTSGMEESKTGIVDAYYNPYNLLSRVIVWMYTGKIKISQEELMPLFKVAHNYGVTELENQLLDYMDKNVNENNILDLIKKCYDDELQKELQSLIPYLANLFDKIPILELSSALDVFTFAKVIGLTNLGTEAKILKITEFLQDWVPSIEEKMALFDAFKPDETNIKQLASKHNATWLP